VAVRRHRTQAARTSVALRRRQHGRDSVRRSIDLDILNERLGYFVRRFQLWIFDDFIHTLAPADVTPAQYSVLVVIGANRGLSQMDLSHALGIERARLARLLHRLERRGLVRRLAAPDDRRTHALVLTRHGRATLKQAKALASLHERRVIDRIGEETHKTILEALRVSFQ
jgi:DNA-binding MarR family transcriptional regulator